MTTDEKLEQLRKAAQQKAATSSAFTPWQEPLSRFTSVSSSKSLQAADVVSGLAGSWAAFVKDGLGIGLDGAKGEPAPSQVKTHKLGHPGNPEINFVPYNWGTNRSGTKGPSLIGHPIALSVVGPTLKSPANIWQWLVTDNTATPGLGDTLTFDTVDSALSTTGVPVAPSATLQTMAGAYKLTPGPASTAFPGGLYMVVLLSGAPGTAPAANSGVADGFIGDGAAAGKLPLTPYDPTSKYEIFRVETILVNGVRLDPNKRLSSHFWTTPPVYVRSVMFFEPHVARMGAMPGYPVGKEQTFVVLPPTKAATGDFLPPYDGGIALDGTWVRGGFNLDDPAKTGVGAYYTEKVTLPVGRPVDRRIGQAQLVSGGVVSLTTGLMKILSIGTVTTIADVGKILRVYQVSRTGQAPFLSPQGDNTTESDFLGWYEIVGAGGTDYDVRRIAGVDPTTGRISWGTTSALAIDDSLVPGSLQLYFTLHESINSLHTANYVDSDKLASTRLTNLIDPAWSERTVKTPYPPYVQEGFSPARADRVIWNTRTNSNPGSLLDLGFRMVLYPAKAGVGVIQPDWDHPIDSREVTLDPSINEAQYLDIDYSAGVVRLSHPPVPGVGCDVAPNGIIGLENPRGEIVLFAACVPYSMEEGQLGAGFRATSLIRGITAACNIGGGPAQADVYSDRIVAEVASTFNDVAQTITSGVGQTIYLWNVEPDLPPTGFVDLRVANANGPPAFVGPGGEPLGLFGYTAKQTVLDPARAVNVTKLVGCFGGGSYGVDTTPGAGLVAVLRRDIRTPVDATGIAGTRYEYDTTYGFAKRSNTIRFEDATLTPQQDGSLTVSLEGGAAAQAIFEDLFSSLVISGGALTFPGGLVADIADTTVLLKGRKFFVPADSVTVPGGGPGTFYFYVDGTTDPLCPVFTYATSLPLPGVDDILIARTDRQLGVLAPATYIDLTNPVRDIDRRVDITVGSYPGWTSSPAPHFATLAEAIAFVGEIMEPPSGTSGRSYLIRVIGPTYETVVPIQMPTDGVIIEGAAIRTTGGVQPTIHWDMAATPLFDLRGKNNLVFQNLAFEYDDVGQPADASGHQVLFYNDFSGVGGQLVERLTIRNVRFEGNGKAHGFLRGGFATSGFDSCLFEDNYSRTTDFGYVIDGPNATGCSFLRNTIHQNGTYQGSVLYRSGIGLSSPINIINRVRDNNIVGFHRGVYSASAASSTGNVVSDNYIFNTVEIGIHVTKADTTVRGNILQNVHTSGVFNYLQTYKIGIWQADSAGTNTKIHDNIVVLNAPAVASRAIKITANYCEVVGNTVNQSFQTEDYALVRDNVIDGTGAGSDLWIETNCRVFGNVIPGDLRIQTNAIVQGNTLGSLSVLPACTGALIQGNIVAGGATVTIDDSVFQGNTWGSAVAITGVRNSFSDNVLPTAGVTVTGFYNTLDANQLPVGTLTITAGNFAVVTGNRTQNVSVTGHSCVVSDNFADLDFTTSGNFCVVEGNRATNIISITGNDGSFGSNFSGSNTTVTGNSNVFDGNKVYGNLVVSGPADNSVIDSNFVGNDLTVTGDSIVVDSNNVDGDLAVTGNSCVVDGNKVNLTLTVTGVGNVVTDNEPTTVSVTGGSYQTVKGNKCTSLTVTANGSTLQGNQVTGEIVIFDAGVPQTTGAVVMGNTCNSIDHQAPNCILMGNRIMAADLGSGNIGIRNSTAANARPSNTVLVGNMIGNNTLGFSIVYLNAAWASEANDINIQGS